MDMCVCMRVLRELLISILYHQLPVSPAVTETLIATSVNHVHLIPTNLKDFKHHVLSVLTLLRLNILAL